jgi:two-component system, chemotaxis family, chemotaxis protein CheY
MRDIIITPSSRRILVAEDDALIMLMVTAILESEGYVVVPARDGREAYRILRLDADFVAAIFDMNMPHLRGLDVTSHMQTERRLKRIPVMMMTSERDLTICSKVFPAGAALFLQKPFTPTQMRFMFRLLVSQGAGSRNRRTDPHKALAA